MSETIDHISINDIFWIKIKRDMINFGFKELPKGIHCTISYNDNNPDFNFHITKNASDPENKPKITIFVMDKKVFADSVQFLGMSFISRILEPFDINELKDKYEYELGFFSFDDLEKSEMYSLTEKQMIASFRKLSRKGGGRTRLKIQGDVGKELEQLANSNEIQTAVMNDIVDLPHEYQKPIEGGIIITEENTLQVIRLNASWYKIRIDLEPIDFISAFVEPKLAAHLIEKTKHALEAIKDAETYKDTEHLDKPIRLVRIENKEKTETG